MSGPGITLGQISDSLSTRPPDIDWVLHYFIEKGFTYKEFEETPLPVILRVLRVEKHIAKKKKQNQK
jgi:hypothetical protein